MLPAASVVRLGDSELLEVVPPTSPTNVVTPLAIICKFEDVPLTPSSASVERNVTSVPTSSCVLPQFDGVLIELLAGRDDAAWEKHFAGAGGLERRQAGRRSNGAGERRPVRRRGDQSEGAVDRTVRRHGAADAVTLTSPASVTGWEK